jgi:hypothetical protein
MSLVVRGPASMLELARGLADDGAAPGGLPVLWVKNLFALPRDEVPFSPYSLYVVQCATGQLASI